MSTTKFTHEGKQYQFLLEQDELEDSPRVGQDNLGTMVCWSKRYTLGDKHDFATPQDFGAALTAQDIVLPLFLLDHSGISIRTHNFADCDPGQWDSGLVGYIYVTQDKIIAEYGDDTIDNRKKAAAVLKCEVKIYDQYLQGDVYVFCLEEVVTCDHCGASYEVHVESCGGIYGRDIRENGILDFVPKELHAALLAAWDKTGGY